MSTIQSTLESHAPVASDRTADPARVRDWLSRNRAILIDVREPDERLRESIPGSVSIPLARLTATALPRAEGQTIICHCKSGRRSAEAVSRLAAAGVEALSMSGGIDAWKREGLPVQTNARVPISIMRQVQVTVGFTVLLGTVGAWLISEYLLVIPAFMGAGLLFAGLSGTCALAAMLGWMPWNKAFRQSAAPAAKSCCDAGAGTCRADPKHESQHIK